MTTYGKGDCPNCKLELGPIPLGEIIYTYATLTVYALTEPTPCPHCNHILTEFEVYMLPTDMVVEKREVEK